MDFVLAQRGDEMVRQMLRRVRQERSVFGRWSGFRETVSRPGHVPGTVLAAMVLVMVLVWLAGCSRSQGRVVIHQPASELIMVNYTVADTLYEALCGTEPCELPLLMSSFVLLDNLDRTSPLGRIIPQQIGSRFTQHGLHLVDVRLRAQSLLVRKGQGEFALSRELEQINADTNAFAVLTGTYTVVYGRIYVTAMILRSSDGMMLASLDYFLPLDRRSLRPDLPNGWEALPSGSPRVPPTLEDLPDPHDGTIQPSVLTRTSRVYDHIMAKT